ncbi:hypothetical protein ACPYO6_01465 [Georgenia sp. Z1344]|uniref:hypothetical protein n=1 Tax=Georgenia sp. Z1344 TaxID=3416706 RepID=UPI003CE72E72
MPRHLPRTLTTALAAGLLATTLAACGGDDELTEAEACEEYTTTFEEFGERSAEEGGPDAGTDLYEEYETEMLDLAERSPENLTPLFEEEAALMRAIVDGTADVTMLESSQENTAAIEEICG